ncbi:class I SAM-dependent methyltransferase [Streptomyces chiangmaiensis]
MDKVESALVNSGPRRALQRFYEAPLLARLGGRIPGGRAVEIGCGSGYGTRLILDRFGAAWVDAVDLDPRAVESARLRLAGYGDRVRIAVGSATDLRAALEAEDDGYDAVFGLAIIHHVEDWRAAIAEVARVLRPGGRFYFEEVTLTALNRPTYRRLFDHPREDRFTAGGFLVELPRHGLYRDERWRTRIGGDYVLGVAELRPAG